jgi:dihydrofolate synthase / folylpolyglutamate synthase
MTLKDCRSYLERVEVYGIKFGLDNIRAVLDDLKNPERHFPSVLVAGTNGKGSVCAMLSEGFLRHGLRVGLYTSPHLVSVEERIRLDRRPIPSRDFCRLLSRVKDSCDRLVEAGTLSAPLTYFEHLTALAFLYFREKKVDLAVLEVGMGGRFDATNVVTPLVSVITSIGLDHQKFLGPTLGRIAFEKAGIIKPGVPVVCAPDGGAAYRTIRKRAREMGAPLVGVFDPPAGLRVNKGTTDYRFVYRRDGRTHRFNLRLAGRHQGRNAATAITVASVLSRTWRKVEFGKLLAGIRQADWPGRLEVFGRKPLVMLDGAHNEEGASALAAYVRDFMPKPVSLVFAVMRDKDIRPIVRKLFPRARRIILTTIPMHRAAVPEEVLSQAGMFRAKTILEPDLKQALAVAKALALKAKGSVLVAGSLFLVGECKKLSHR